MEYQPWRQKQLDQIPVLYVRGTHYNVGYTIGRQFKSMIDDLVSNWIFLNKVVIPIYMTSEGKVIYETNLALCKQKFPHYVEELQGMADGSEIPFHKLFLLHIDSLIAPPDAEDEYFKCKLGTGCTSILANSDKVYLGHTEDACPEFLNNVYIVSAEVLGKDGERLEKFTTLTYAGHLPGYTMGFNAAGLVYSVNTIYVKRTFADRSPRNFLTRAILGASNMNQVLTILRDTGTGTSDAFSLNLTFTKQEGTPVLHNVEVGPNQEGKAESELSVLTLTHGDCHAHCNKLLRLQIPELPGIGWDSSVHRHKVIGKHFKPNSLERIKAILSDQTDPEYSIYRVGGKQDYCKTVAVGIFDILKKTWSIFMGPPATTSPVAVIPME